MADAHKNLAYSLVATAPSPATSGTSLVVTAGEGTRFPAVPFNATVWATGAIPIPTNAEIVRVTNISTDTLTITRAQESTSARTIVVGDQIAATITAKTLTDVESESVILAPAASARNVIQPTAGAVIAAVLKAHASQSVDLLELQKSDATVWAKVDSAGAWTISPDTMDMPRLTLVETQTGATTGTNFSFRVFNAYGDPEVIIGTTKYAANTNREGSVTLRAHTAANAQIGLFSFLGGGNMEAGVDLTSVLYPIYFYDYVTGDQIFTVTVAGNPIFGGHAATANGDLTAGDWTAYLDATNGAAKMLFKAKTLDGTVTTWTIPSGTIYVVGGTDVAVADGGTGSSTAAGAATNLGLGTGDSPQFTAVNIGAATDTTVTRTGAGDIAVEGNAIYRAGGTDVAVADGGTGASTAATGLSNLGGIAAAIVDAKGDIIAATAADTVARVAVGANNSVLTADSAQTAGVKWGAVVAASPEQSSFISARYTALGIRKDNALEVTYTQNALGAFPFYVPYEITLDRIGVYVSTTVALSVCRLGIYNDNGAGAPGTLLLDAGTIDSHTAGGFIELTISQALSAGTIYWAAWAAQTATCKLYSMIMDGRSYSTGAIASANRIGYYIATAACSGALPTPFGAFGNSAQEQVACFAARIV